MKRILFQGDSITDAGRNTNAGIPISIGQGYALMVAGELSYRDVKDYEFINKGISGNRIVDFYARIKKDVWNLKPDIISMLLGVNDALHEFGQENGVDAKRFEQMYRMCIDETMQRLPETKFILMEPFCLPGALCGEFYDELRKEVELRAEAVQRIASEYQIPFVSLQALFDEKAKEGGPNDWLADGIHPTSAGHRLIAKAWLQVYEQSLLE